MLTNTLYEDLLHVVILNIKQNKIFSIDIMNEHNYILLSIFIILIIVIPCFWYQITASRDLRKWETFSPLGYPSNCAKGVNNLSKAYKLGKKKRKIKTCNKENVQLQFPNQDTLPLRYCSTIGSPDINGNKTCSPYMMKKRNPYGTVVPDGNQTYGCCDETILNNPFNVTQAIKPIPNPNLYVPFLK